MREQPYNTIIIDDDDIAIAQLVTALKEHPDFCVVDSAHNTIDGRRKIFEHRPDLLFLDVELPDDSGISLLNAIKSSVDWNMCVVFYSAHSQYILSAMRESAFDFLLKPFEPSELSGILDRFKQEFAKQQPTLNIAGTDLIKDSFIAATIKGFRIIRHDEIGFFTHKGERKQWYAHLVGNESLCLRRGTSADNILSYSPAFVQISQSTIININYLVEICGKECIFAPPFDKETDLTISRNYLKKLQQILNLI
ncbi:MAG: response regulator transcription factor [Muribaculaceae bacterium]|nr:response regulator transcription factor [Muribaculaceae bacterium]